jgi:hypothetical protein
MRRPSTFNVASLDICQLRHSFLLRRFIRRISLVAVFGRAARTSCGRPALHFLIAPFTFHAAAPLSVPLIHLARSDWR